MVHIRGRKMCFRKCFDATVAAVVVHDGIEKKNTHKKMLSVRLLFTSASTYVRDYGFFLRMTFHLAHSTTQIFSSRLALLLFSDSIFFH